jgi:hypothetical protein
MRVELILASLEGEGRKSADSLLFDCGMKYILFATIERGVARLDKL